jgi:hypothetical protein
MTDSIVQDVERALVLPIALEAGNDTIREIRGDGPALSFYGARTYEAIRLGLTVSLALTLANLFDPETLYVSRKKKGQQKSANKSDIISIPLLVGLLKQRRCQTVLGKQARDWTPMLDHMKAVNEESAIGAANAAVAAYENFRRSHDGRSAARILKTFRNRDLAHRLLDKRAPPPRYRELFLLLDVAAAVATKARLAVMGPAIKGMIEVDRRRQVRSVLAPGNRCRRRSRRRCPRSRRLRPTRTARGLSGHVAARRGRPAPPMRDVRRTSMWGEEPPSPNRLGLESPRLAK